MYNYNLDEIKSELAFESEVLAFEEDYINFEKLCDIAKSNVAMENKITDLISSGVGKAKKFINTLFGWFNSVISRFMKLGKTMRKDLHKLMDKIRKKMKSVSIARESMEFATESDDMDTLLRDVNALISYIIAIHVVYVGSDVERYFYREGSALKRVTIDFILGCLVTIPIKLLIAALTPELFLFLGSLAEIEGWLFLTTRNQYKALGAGVESFKSFSTLYLQEILTPTGLKKVTKAARKAMEKVSASRIFTSSVKDKIMEEVHNALYKSDWVTALDLSRSVDLLDANYKKGSLDKLQSQIRESTEKLRETAMQKVDDVTTMRMDKTTALRDNIKDCEELTKVLRDFIRDAAN